MISLNGMRLVPFSINVQSPKCVQSFESSHLLKAEVRISFFSYSFCILRRKQEPVFHFRKQFVNLEGI
jgi:hypothetical protein